MVRFVAVIIGVALLGHMGMSAQQRAVNYDYVASLLIKDDGYVVIKVWTASTGVGFKPEQVQGCGNASYGEFKNPLPDERTKAMMEMAQTSVITRAKVYVITDGCTPGRIGAAANRFPKITGFAICRDGIDSCP